MARKLCLILIILLVLAAGNLKKAPKAHAQTSNKVTVSAVVLEQINYQRNGQSISVGTNYEKGFWVISKKSLGRSFEKKTAFELPLSEKIIIVPKI